MMLAAYWRPTASLQRQIDVAAQAMGWHGNTTVGTRASVQGGVIGMHVRRGDACHCPTHTDCHVPKQLVAVAGWRHCVPLASFVDKARALRQMVRDGNVKGGNIGRQQLDTIYLATDSAATKKQTAHFPDFRWIYIDDTALPGADEVARAAERISKFYEDSTEFAKKHGHLFTVMSLIDLHMLSASNAFIGSDSAYSSFALMLNAGRRGALPPFVLPAARWPAGALNELSTSMADDVTYEDDCFERCGNKGGDCPGHCGALGVCCRKGWADDGPECDDNVRVGKLHSDHHVCATKRKHKLPSWWTWD